MGIPGLTGTPSRTDPARDIMKKPPEDDDLRPHYDFDYSKMKPNRFAGVKKIHKESTMPTKSARKTSRDPKK